MYNFLALGDQDRTKKEKQKLKYSSTTIEDESIHDLISLNFILPVVKNLLEMDWRIQNFGKILHK